MRAGKLRHYKNIEVPDDKAATWNAGAQGWTTFASVWCSIEPVGSRELSAAGSMGGEVTHRIRMRYISGLKPNMRISHNGRYLKFGPSRIVDERNREIEIEATETV